MNKFLKAASVAAILLVIQHHIPMSWWEGLLLGFGCTMLVIG
jgi:hypothetical protein